MSFSSPSASNPSLATSAYMVSSVDRYTSCSDDEIASLPSESTTSSDLDTLSDDYSDAEEEWRESIEQLELLLTMVIVPFIGKYLGRRCAYWGWTRFMEWKYPVEVVITNKAAFRGAGVVEALSPLELYEEQQQLPSLEVVASFRDGGSLVTSKTRKLTSQLMS
ncbi:hypothetical protein KXX35_003346 [Aspergillus fumigatus]|nr:hypothetical protein KXX40_001074 [Aspergillus fumigatus]KAH1723894.1 hypothetical protein KXX25_000897 [Aspergillus fumigatus]KAH1782553.1 hypothetical protein KXX20_002068 [Aspergillus fumigatus]KAH1816777.1 hypothetical protein KXX35_003346 [Aspergillus fumigatus]KAH2084268.1 hypothetical protein KXW86_000648 [Aspergillus fumigatus]